MDHRAVDKNVVKARSGEVGVSGSLEDGDAFRLAAVVVAGASGVSR